MSADKKTGCDEIELGKLYGHSQRRFPTLGFGTMQVISSNGQPRTIRMQQPQIVFDPDETQPSDITQPIDFVGLERAAEAVRVTRDQQPKSRFLWRLITFFWSVVNGRK